MDKRKRFEVDDVDVSKDEVNDEGVEMQNDDETHKVNKIKKKKKRVKQKQAQEEEKTQAECNAVDVKEEAKDEIDEQKPSTSNGRVKKPRKPGVLYFSSVPYLMTPTRLKQIMSQYGKVRHVFLQKRKYKNEKGNKERHYSEGWLEFADRRIAKRVAASLNAQPVGGSKRSMMAECLWTIKYLHRFTWEHLREQLEYENAVHAQRMRVEIAQAKRQAHHFQHAVEKGAKLKALEERVLRKGGLWETYQRQQKGQRKAIDSKKEAQKAKESTSQLMSMIFDE